MGVVDRIFLFLMPLLVKFPTLIQLFYFSFLVFSNRIYRASTNIPALLHSSLNYLWSSGNYEELPPPSGAVSDTRESCPGDRELEGWMVAGYPGRGGRQHSFSARLVPEFRVADCSLQAWLKIELQLQWSLHLLAMGDVVYAPNCLHSRHTAWTGG